MSTLFTLVHLAALVCFIVFLVKMLKLKKAGEDHGQAKKLMLISIAVWIVSFIIVGITTPSTKDNQTGDSTATTEESTSKSEDVKDETLDVASETSTKAEDKGNASKYKKDTTLTDEPEDTQQEDDSNKIILEAGTLGEYGKDLVLNAGTEFEDKTIGFFVPSGKYEVTNIGDHMTQVNVYKNEKNVVDGWEEWADCVVELVDVGETKEMTVTDGYFFNIDPPARITIKKVD